MTHVYGHNSRHCYKYRDGSSIHAFNFFPDARLLSLIVNGSFVHNTSQTAHRYGNRWTNNVSCHEYFECELRHEGSILGLQIVPGLAGKR